jgi:hypothetical protein
LPDKFVGCYSNSGWVNIGILKVLFEKINMFTNNTPSVLLLDSFAAHINKETINLAEKNNIKLIFIPPGTTNKFQPLDVKIHALKACAKRLNKEKLIDDNNIKMDLNESLQQLDIAIKSVINELIRDSFKESINI